MKKLFFLIAIALCYSIAVQAQTASVTFFAKEGEKFWVIIDGAKMNPKPDTRVKINNLSAAQSKRYHVKILFDDSKLGSFDDNFYLAGVDGPMDLVYEIRKNKKKQYVIHMNSFEKAAGNTPDNGGGTTIMYGPASTNTTTTNTTTTGDNNTNTTQTVKKTTTTQTTVTDPNTSTKTNTGMNVKTDGMNTNISVTDPNGNTTNMNVGVDVNMDPNSTGMNTKVNVGGNQNGQNVQNTNTTTTTTKTTVTTTTTGNGGNMGDGNHNRENYQRRERLENKDQKPRCAAPMSNADFQVVKNSITKQSFADEKLKVAEQVTKVKCISAAQVKEIMGMFSFESNKLDYAKFAYDYTIDKDNYFTINDAFSFSSSVDELNTYIESKGK